MAGRSRARPDRKKRNPSQFPELGLFDIPNLDALEASDGSEVDESALESELEALMSGKAPSKPSRPKPKAKPAIDIERLAADCLKDIEDDNEDDEDLSTDEDLLSELKVLTIGDAEEFETPESVPEEKSSAMNDAESANVLGVLHERLNMYNEAIKAEKKAGDTSKVRRYGRALKTIEALLKSANAGASINEEDIPPPVKIQRIMSDSEKSLPAPEMDSAESNQSKDQNTNTNYQRQQSSVEGLNDNLLLKTRRDEYKKAALMAKRGGNRELAIQYLKSVKTFDSVLESIDKNLPVDLSNMPPPLDLPNLAAEIATSPKVMNDRFTHNKTQTSSNTDFEKAALAAAEEAEVPEIFAAPPPPSTILEALVQRLEKYSTTKQSAESEGNSGKVRRLERIIKQYEKAIKDYKSGKNVDFSELPSPPGFGPIPVENDEPSSTSVTPMNPSKQNEPNPQKNAAIAKPNPVPEKKPKVQRTNTMANKQLEFLLERQRLFRQAAIGAKKNGDIQQAKEYLRLSKGFDNLIEATKCGLPIDATSIPTPPQLESDFVIVDVSECIENDDRSQEELFDSLEKDLLNQIEICTKNKEHFLRLGDVSSASKFEKLCLESKKDLAVILHLKKKGDPAPRFHYETRLFSVVQCHTDLGDNDIEVTIERGINLPGKPDLDTYVRLEFPIPAETPQRAKTHTVRDTNNPIFQEEFKFEFSRKSRTQLRQFKRGFLKLEVWSKGGFLRTDTHLGTVSVKLSDLESKCSVHDSFNLMDGRKACGGKLEVKIRIRDPLLVKQVEEVREKWLVVGS